MIFLIHVSCHKPLSQCRRQPGVLLIFTLDLKTQMLYTFFFFFPPIMKTIKSSLNTSNGKNVLPAPGILFHS